MKWATLLLLVLALSGCAIVSGEVAVPATETTPECRAEFLSVRWPFMDQDREVLITGCGIEALVTNSVNKEAANALMKSINHLTFLLSKVPGAP